MICANSPHDSGPSMKDGRADSVVIMLDSVDDGTHDSDIHPQIRVQKKPDVTDQAVAQLWFDDLERFPYHF
jgi:hypothetical protein